RTARREVPALAEASILLGNVFRALDRADSAEACLLFATKVEPTNITARDWLGDLFVSQNRLQEAENSYLDAVRMNPDYWVAQRILGVFYDGQHRDDDAARAWQQAIALAPNDVLTLNNLGVVHYRRGEWRAAQQLFLQSFKTRPDCPSCDNVATTFFR